MNAFRKTLLAASLTVGALPGWSPAAEPPRPAQPAQAAQPARQADLQRQLEEARRRLEMATAEMARLSGEMGRGFTYRFEGAGQPRSLLGVDMEPNEKKDGVHVRQVSPGGAAEEAGIKPGDIITSIGGQDLSKEEDPNRALVERMGQMAPNLKVQVGVLRDGKKMNFDVTPRPSPVAANTELYSRLVSGVRENQQQSGRGFTTAVPPAGFATGTRNGEQRLEIRTIGEGPDDGTRFRDMEFATLSEKLGGYFGVKAGVLVVRAGANTAFKLQDGDVILAIDGREPTSAQHAGRILRSYGDGEKLKLRVQRDRKAQDIEITMPNGAGERGVRGDVLRQRTN